MKAAIRERLERQVVGANAWGWTPWGLSFAMGMALHRIAMDGTERRVASMPPAEYAERRRRYPNNTFVQNEQWADVLVACYWLAHAMPVHDRPEWTARMAGAYGRPDGGHVRPHALHGLFAGASTLRHG